MVGLTPLGKLFFGGIALIIIVAAILVLFPSIQFSFPPFSAPWPDASDSGGTPLVKVFVASYGKESVAAVSMLREISKSEEFKGKFDYQIIQIETSSGQANGFKISKIPSFIIGSKLYEGQQTREFIEGKLREIIKK